MKSKATSKHIVEITHEEKILFPKTHITKGELVNYYKLIAPTMLPYMHDRPISMQRFPEGIGHEGFYQKNAPDYFPPWITTKKIKRKDEVAVHYVVCNDQPTLLYLANQLCVTPHIWLSRIDKLNYPDRLIFDLDPSSKDFSLVIAAARELKKRLESHGLVPFVMTTGSRGLHVVVPLKRNKTFEYVRTFAHTLATELAHDFPDAFTVELRKEKRKGRVFIDYLRNGFGATGVAPYAVRALEGAPVATPLAWTELTKTLTPQKYTIKNIFKRLTRRADPWATLASSAQNM